jgi:hypothetical protein
MWLEDDDDARVVGKFVVSPGVSLEVSRGMSPKVSPVVSPGVLPMTP